MVMNEYTARSTYEEIEADHKMILKSEFITQFAEATNTFFLILNENRQVVYGNKFLLDLLKLKKGEVIGKRVGEMLHCINSNKNQTGCGTHGFCKQCGAMKAIVSALKGKASSNECRIFSVEDKQVTAYDLEVKATNFKYEGRNYILFSANDVSDKRRREVLEKIFFHDILNSAGGVNGLSGLLVSEIENNSAEALKTAEMVHNSSNRLIKEIQSQKLLMSAEMNNLNVNEVQLSSKEFMTSVINLIKENDAVQSCEVVLSETDNIIFYSDLALLQRVLVNMIKNAAEASKPGQIVSVKAEDKSDKILFSVHNETWMPENVKTQIFQRSFSTKGASRGIGTYSMKLFGETYLGGRVFFVSEENIGTTFFLEISKKM